MIDKKRWGRASVELNWSSKSVQRLLISLLLVYAVLIQIVPIDLYIADIGRHIKNGEAFFQTFQPVTTNFYSYTEPDRYTVNHHWGAGVLYYLIWTLGGFPALSIFKIFISILALLLFFLVAIKKSNFKVALFCTLLAVPFLKMRPEIRPECLSYFMMAAYFYLFDRFHRDKISFKSLCILIVTLQIIWANVHIYFVVGIVFIGVFWLDSLVSGEKRNQSNRLLALGVLAALVCCINPSGLKGALIPFTIFRSYGLQPVENLTVWFYVEQSIGYVTHLINSGFMNRNWLLPSITPFLLVLQYVFIFMGVICAGVCALIRIKSKKHLLPLLMLIAFGGLGCVVNRSMLIFAYLFIPIGSGITFDLFAASRDKLREMIRGLAVGFCLIWVVPGIFYEPNPYAVNVNNLHIGVGSKTNDSINFFTENQIAGPILNNYDIGSYLIFHLFPGERVFVDNRPEAYSEGFFQDEYRPAFEAEAKWQQLDHKYRFNVIFMYKYNQSNELTDFLLRRAQDLEWALVYVDEFAIILLKRNAKNSEVIKRFEMSGMRFENIVHEARDNVIQGVLLAADGDVQSAMEDFRAALKIDGDYVDAHYYLAHAHLYLGDLEMAINEFEKVLELDSGNAMAALEIGRIYLNEHQFIKAAEYLDKAMRLKPDLREAHAALASLYERQGDYKKALIFNQNLRLLDKNNKLAIDNADGFVRKDEVETSTR
jgi:tetratricopeptide (TPR) repeat protein